MGTAYRVKGGIILIISNILRDAYNKLVGVQDENDEIDTEQDLMIKIILFCIILFQLLHVYGIYYKYSNSKKVKICRRQLL